MAQSITADEIREEFSQAMSAMYQQEVPQYGTLLELVADVNLAVLECNTRLHEKLANADELARLNVERHGAIRVGTAAELSMLRRMFAIYGDAAGQLLRFIAGGRPGALHRLSPGRGRGAVAQSLSRVYLAAAAGTD